MGRPSASLVLVPNGNLVGITPEGGGVRRLERGLAATGIDVLVRRAPPTVFVQVGDLARVRQALLGWDLRFGPGVEESAARLIASEVALECAKRTLADLTRPGVADQALADFPEKALLDPHQVEAVAAATHLEIAGLCLFDEQGLGKTIEALFAFHRLRQLNAAKLALVFAPKNMVLEWKRDCHRFFGNRYRVVTVTGSEREKRRSLSEPADIYVTNFETAVNLRVRLKHLLRADTGRNLLVVDESFFVKNPGAARTLAIRDLRRVVKRCLVLCGTPAPNSPHDLVEQFNIADGGVAFAGVDIPADRNAARPIISRIIESRGVYIRRLKEHVLPDLPTKTFHRVLVPMEDQQRRAYEAGLVGLIEELQRTDDLAFKKQITTFMAKRLALLQICSHPAAVVDGYHEIPAKLKALDSILEELITIRGEKVIIWTYFTKSLNAIMNRYDHFGSVRVDGIVSDPMARRDAVRRFQEDDTTMLFVGNPAAAGSGLTLHRARFAVYESMSNQAAHYWQSLDRIHRRGQLRDVEYIVLLCDGTLEVHEYERLIMKESAAQSLLGDVVTPPPTRDSFLNEALEASRLLGLQK